MERARANGKFGVLYLTGGENSQLWKVATPPGLAVRELVVSGSHQPVKVADRPTRRKYSTPTGPADHFPHFPEHFLLHHIEDRGHLVGVPTDQWPSAPAPGGGGGGATYTLVLAADVMTAPLSPTMSTPVKRVLNILGWAGDKESECQCSSRHARPYLCAQRIGGPSCRAPRPLHC